MPMKLIVPFFLSSILLASTGCISTHLVNDRAKSHLEYDVENQQSRKIDGRSGYYALLPLTILGDVATSPFQLGWFILFDRKSGEASFDGVPIPLPKDFINAK